MSATWMVVIKGALCDRSTTPDAVRSDDRAAGCCRHFLRKFDREFEILKTSANFGIWLLRLRSEGSPQRCTTRHTARVTGQRNANRVPD